MPRLSSSNTLLRQARTRAALTHTQVAARVGVSREAVVGWETGSQVVPLARLRQLADLYACSSEQRDALYAEAGYLAPELERALLEHAEVWNELRSRLRKTG